MGEFTDKAGKYVVDTFNDGANAIIPGIAGDKSGKRKERRDAKVNKRMGADVLDAAAGSNVLQYPQDLFQSNQVNGVCFYIMVRKNSVAAQAAGDSISGAAAERINAHKDSRSEFATNVNRSSVENYQTVTNTAGIVAGATIAKGLESMTSLGNSKTGGTGGFKDKLYAGAKGLVMPAAGAGLGLLAAETILAPGDEGNKLAGTQYLNKVIQMHVPQSIISQYQADWNETELGTAGLLANKRLDQASVGEVGEAAIRGLIKGAANVPKAIGVDADLGAALEATSRKVLNPYKEQLFKSIGFRKFAFQYVFSPKNEQEYNNVRAIINTFKYHMHPDISPGGTFLIYPSEFSIEFLHADEGKVARNEHLPKISDCALQDVKVTYGPDGFFNTIAASGGIPSEITMELAFTELETLTANRIDDGY
jgi:hypothetical protein